MANQNPQTTNFANTNAEGDNGIQIWTLLSLVLNHKRWYLLSLLICFCVAGLYIYRTQPQYQRETKVLLDESTQKSTLKNLGVLADVPGGIMGNSAVANEIETFSSPDLMEMVITRLGLQTQYTEKQFFRSRVLYQNCPIEMVLAGDNPVSGFTFRVSSTSDGKIRLHNFVFKNEKIKENIVANFRDTISTPVGKMIIFPTEHFEGKLKNEIVVNWNTSMARAKQYGNKLNVNKVNKEATVLSMTIEDYYPQRASAILNSLVDVYNETWISNKNKSIVNTSEFISERLVVIESELASVENSLKDYKASHNISDLQAAAQVIMQESSQYSSLAFENNNRLTIARYIRDYLNNPANNLQLIPQNLGLDNGSVDSQIGSYNQLVLKRDQLVSTSSEQNPVVADLTASISAMRLAILGSVENLIATLTIQQDKIDAQEKQILARIASSSGQELQLLSIERKQQITQELYMFLLQRREENELAALVNVGNTRVIMLPNGSDMPTNVSKAKILLIAFVLGFGLPFAIFFLLMTLDTTVKTKEDLKNLTVPMLAEIPLYVDTSVKRTIKDIIYKRVQDNTKVLVRPGKRD